MWKKPFRKSSNQRTVARKIAKVEALSRVLERTGFMLEDAHGARIHEAGRRRRMVVMVIVDTNSIGCFAFGLHGCDPVR